MANVSPNTSFFMQAVTTNNKTLTSGKQQFHNTDKNFERLLYSIIIKQLNTSIKKEPKINTCVFAIFILNIFFFPS